MVAKNASRIASISGVMESSFPFSPFAARAPTTSPYVPRRVNDVTRSRDATRDAPGAKEESDYQRYSLTSLPFSLIHLHCSFFSFSFNEAVALSNAPPSPYPPSPGWWMDSCNRPVPLGGRGTAGRWFMAGGRARVWHSAGHCEGTGHSDLDERGWGFGCGCGHVTVNAWCFISFIY